MEAGEPMTDDQLKAIEARATQVLSASLPLEGQYSIVQARDLAALIAEVRRLRERQCALRELIGEFSGDSETTGVLLEQFARRAGLID